MSRVMNAKYFKVGDRPLSVGSHPVISDLLCDINNATDLPVLTKRLTVLVAVNK